MNEAFDQAGATLGPLIISLVLYKHDSYQAGFADFALIAYHFQKTGSVAGPVIPIYYVIAMALGGTGALLFGRWFDRAGLSVLIVVIFISAFFAPLAFFGRTWIALCGMILWGIGMRAQNSLLKSVVAPLLRRDVRATGFGVFDTISASPGLSAVGASFTENRFLH